MRQNFDACFAELLRHEGGLVNDKRDPGGLTNMGISQRSYPKENIRGMTRARAAVIYRRDFWDAVKGDDLPAGLDLVAFDAAVNSGASRSAKWLQAALGASQDGKIGPVTVAKAKAADPATAIARACDARMAFLRRLATWDAFGRGWTRRVDAVRTAALAMVDPPRPEPKPIPRPVPKPAPPAPAIRTGPPGITVAGLIFGAAVAAFAFIKWG